MKRTFITNLPDEAGSFYKACRVIASQKGNITRVSYNKSVDMHTLFVDVEASAQDISDISNLLDALGYISDMHDDAKVILMEFKLKDIPGTLLPVLKLIDSYSFNISYINSSSNNTGYQDFRMGLYIDNPEVVKEFLTLCSKLCPIKIISYDTGESILDNTVFYLSFASELSSLMGLEPESAEQLVSYSNQIMQRLENEGELPQKTFSYIRKFAEFIQDHKGINYTPRVTKIHLDENLILHCIEPPCGSNTYIFQLKDALLFIDTGFACYEKEFLKTVRTSIPDYDSLKKVVMITHPDLDHCGLANLFDEIRMSSEAMENFELELKQLPNFREMNEIHMPYSMISKILSAYKGIVINKVKPFKAVAADKPIVYADSFSYYGLEFEIYISAGGHTLGEIVAVEKNHKLVISGDIFVNINGFTQEQDEFNKIAPYLMTSVNTDTVKASINRKYLLDLFPQSEYSYLPGHGSIIPIKNEHL